MPDPKPQQGYLVLADISGFTAFVTSTELEHSQAIMRELLELIVQRLTPTLTLAALEGDAVFAYLPESRLTRNEMLFELIEATYVTFRERQLNMQRNTTCLCQACRALSSLDLKFIAHYGAYITPHIAERDELMSLDVRLVRERWLKNPIGGEAMRGHALFTDVCLAQMGVSAEGMTAHSASYEHIGAVPAHSLSLRAYYQALLDARRVFITAEEADATFARDFAAPPPVVWDWLNDPHKRNQWMMSGQVWSVGARLRGRTAIGTTNHCDHKGTRATETILDWRPFDYFTAQLQQSPMPMLLLQTLQLEALPNGTRLRVQLKIKTRLPRRLTRLMMRWLVIPELDYEQMMGRMAGLMQQEVGQVSNLSNKR
jgi:uncharacterized protein YndB with AHSA1/START domain